MTAITAHLVRIGSGRALHVGLEQDPSTPTCRRWGKPVSATVVRSFEVPFDQVSVGYRLAIVEAMTSDERAQVCRSCFKGGEVEAVEARDAAEAALDEAPAATMTADQAREVVAAWYFDPTGGQMTKPLDQVLPERYLDLPARTLEDVQAGDHVNVFPDGGFKYARQATRFPRFVRHARTEEPTIVVDAGDGHGYAYAPVHAVHVSQPVELILARHERDLELVAQAEAVLSALAVDDSLDDQDAQPLEASTKTLVVIPCSAGKLEHVAPAGELYVGGLHRLARRAADELVRDLPGAQVVILSAEHGLLRLDETVAPYDLKMGDPGTIGAEALVAQLEDLGNPRRVIALLPNAYAAKLSEALGSWVEASWPLAGSRGIGEQRGRLSRIAKAGALAHDRDLDQAQLLDETLDWAELAASPLEALPLGDVLAGHP